MPTTARADGPSAATACSDDDSGSSASDSSEDSGDSGDDSSGGVYDEVVERGTLNCGVNDSVPGFGFQDDQGEFVGFDIDYCKAVAAAVLGDPEAVEYVVLTPDQRFPALKSGEIDVLIRNTTWTSTRDGTEAAAFVTTTFYDGQAMMVNTSAGSRINQTNATQPPSTLRISLSPSLFLVLCIPI